MNTTEKVFSEEGFLINRKNRCCVCGNDLNLNRHHIVPSCYIKALKEDIKIELKKDHPYYYEWDYCCTCGTCHNKYETNFGFKLHLLIWGMFDIDLELTSYKKVGSNLIKPSEAVMQKVTTKIHYIKLRNLCTDFFKVNMKPKFDLI